MNNSNKGMKCYQCQTYKVIDITDFDDGENIYFCTECERTLDYRDKLYMKIDLLEKRHENLSIIADIAEDEIFVINVIIESEDAEEINIIVSDIESEIGDYLE